MTIEYKAFLREEVLKIWSLWNCVGSSVVDGFIVSKGKMSLEKFGPFCCGYFFISYLISMDTLI